MKKKILSLLLCISMLCGVLSGCGDSTDKNTETTQTEENTQDISTEQTTENTEVVETELEEEINVVTIDEYNKWVQDFLQLYLGCQVDYHFGNCNVEPINVTTMLEHPKVLGFATYADEFKIPVHNYDDRLYVLDINIASIIGRYNEGDKSQINYRTELVLQECSMDNNFKYYDNTTQRLSSVYKVNYYIDDNLIRDDLYFASQWYYDEFEWLMEFCGFVDSTDYLPMKGTVVEGKVENEDVLKEANSISGTDADEMLRAYWTKVVEYNPKMFFIKTADSNVPYLITISDYGASFYSYEDGIVIDKKMHFSAYDYIDAVKVLPDNKLYVSSFSGSRAEESEIFTIQNGDMVLIDTYDSNWEEWSAKYKIDEGIEGYSDIEEAYENMIIWE